MRLHAFAFALLVLIPGAAGDLSAQDRSNPEANPGSGGSTAPLSLFAGVWDYNAQESVNAANGRPEQAPLSATQRGVGSGRGQGGRPQRGIRDVIAEMQQGVARGRRGGGPGVGPTSMDLAERRDLERDLLEVPEELRIEVQTDAIAFTDDLGRTLVYQTTDEPQEYQLSASRFTARTRWDGFQLRKEVEGAAGFRMTEVYFLSESGDRLFVVLRLGRPDPDPELPPVGYNRVYDRVSSTPES